MVYSELSNRKAVITNFLWRLWTDFLAHDSIYTERSMCYRPSVCLSICPSVCHTGGSVKNGWS